MGEKKMDPQTKKIIFIVGIIIDVVVTLALLVLSIMMVALLPKNGGYSTIPVIGYLQQNTTVFLCAVVLPLFLLLIVNIVGTVFFITKSKELDKEEIVAEVKKTSKPTSLDDLTPEQKAALRKMVIEEARKKYEAEEKKESE